MAGDIIPHSVERVLYMILHDNTYAPRDERPAAKIVKWLKSNALGLMAFGKRLLA